jgi:hypothetical protein
MGYGSVCTRPANPRVKTLQELRREGGGENQVKEEVDRRERAKQDEMQVQCGETKAKVNENGRAIQDVNAHETSWSVG